MQFEVTKADSHKRTQNNSIEVVIPEELQVRVVLKIDIETSRLSHSDGEIILPSDFRRRWTNSTSHLLDDDGQRLGDEHARQ